MTQADQATPVIGLRRPPAIWLGDVVRACTLLRPADDKTRDTIAQILGVASAQTATTGAGLTPTDATPFGTSPSLASVSPGPAGKGDEDAMEDADARSGTPSETTLIPSVLQYVGQVQAQVQLGDPLVPSIGDSVMTELDLQPLLLRVWTRAILTRILATDSRDGPPDVDACIEAIASRRWPRDLPRVLVPTLRRGAQLLLDGSEALQPYLRDQAALERALRLVVGDAVQVLRFVGCPSRGAGAGRRSLWSSQYVPPPSGTVVLVVTDLGIGNAPLTTERAGPDEWVAFASEVRRAGCEPIALVPYAPRRWPADVCRAMNVVHWDRKTTAGKVRRRVGRFRRAAR